MTTDDQLLDELDRRAEAAVAGLTREVADVDVPDLDLAPSTSRWRSPGLLAAAALAIIALVAGAVIWSGRDNRESTVTDRGARTVLGLEDPEAVGYELVGAFDTDQIPTGEQDGFAPVATVFGPAAGGDPWGSAFVLYSLPAEFTTLSGEPISIGADNPTEAMYAEDGIAPTVGWRDGDLVHYVVSRRLSRPQLETVATAAVDHGTSSEALETAGYEMLFSGSLEEIFPYAQAYGSMSPGIRGLAYQELSQPDGESVQFVVRSRAGTRNMVRATTALASSVDHITVRGHDATVTRFELDLDFTTVSWLEDDGTMVTATLAPIGNENETLATAQPLVDSLTEIDDAEFARLLDAHNSFANEGPGPTIDQDVATPDPDGPPPPDLVAESGIIDGDTSIVVQIFDREGRYAIHISDESSSSGTASESSLTGLDSSVATVHDLGNGRVVVAGLIGPIPDVMSMSVFPTVTLQDATRTPVDTREVGGPSASTMIDPRAVRPHDHLVFAVAVPSDLLETGLVLVATAEDGTEVTLDLPRQP